MNTPIALQMHTLRNEGDLETQLSLCHENGIHDIETADFHGLKGEDLTQTLISKNFKVYSAHIGLELLESSWDEVLAYLKALNISICVFPYFKSDNDDEWLGLISKLKEICNRLQEHQIRFAYHNHDHELAQSIQGESILDTILQAIPNMEWEMDVAWVHASGKPVIEYLDRYYDRIHLLHVKDYSAKDETGRPIFCDLGKGIVPLSSLLKQCPKYSIERYILENDDVVNAKQFLASGRDFLMQYFQPL